MDKAEKEKIKDLLCEGKSIEYIAKKLGLVKTDVRKLANNFTSYSRIQREKWLSEHGWSWQFKNGD